MLQEYCRGGVSFRYPSSWDVSEEGTEGQRTITLQTAGASFWSLTIFADRTDPERIVQSVLQAFRDDYEDVDVYPMQDTILEQPTAAADLDFVYLDLVNSAVIRAFQTETASALVIYQGTDHELAVLKEQFDAVTQSLAFEENDEF
jgi:hypothetical protein